MMTFRSACGPLAAVGLLAATALGQVTFSTSVPGQFQDISTSGTPLGLTDDGEADITPAGFTGNPLFPLPPGASVRVGNNGAVSLAAGGDLGFLNTILPTADITPTSGLFDAVSTTLCVFWDDIDADTGDVYWAIETLGGRQVLIIQWDNRPHFSNIGNATFQVQIFGDTTGPLVQYIYEDVDFGDPTFDFGVSATIGIQIDDTEAYTFSFDTPNAVANGDVITLETMLPATPTPVATATPTATLIPTATAIPVATATPTVDPAATAAEPTSTPAAGSTPGDGNGGGGGDGAGGACPCGVGSTGPMILLGLIGLGLLAKRRR